MFVRLTLEKLCQGRQEGHIDQGDLSYAIYMVHVLQVPATCVTSGVHCPTNHLIPGNITAHWVRCININIQCLFLRYKLTNDNIRMIVSIPVDLSPDPELAKMEEKGVEARYVSIELLKELPDGKTEWSMATASRAEGFIPQFIAERTMPSSISHVCVSPHHVQSPRWPKQRSS